jgi:hypothetical protein
MLNVRCSLGFVGSAAAVHSWFAAGPTLTANRQPRCLAAGMKHGITPIKILITFAVVLLFYATAFTWLQHRQTRKGPWEATFVTDPAGNPSITIYQPKLNIAEVKLVFRGEKADQTNLSQTVRFDRVDAVVPFGEVIFHDLMFLPGTVTMDLFGHEVELLPRTLIVNKKEVPWKSNTAIELSPTNKLSVAPKPPKDFHVR